jgi:hypothetical protein
MVSTERATAQKTLHIETDLLEIIDELARAENRSRSRQINVLLREAIAARGPARRPATRKREAA